MKAIIVDDEPANVKNLTILLNKYCPQVQMVPTRSFTCKMVRKYWFLKCLKNMQNFWRIMDL